MRTSARILIATASVSVSSSGAPTGNVSFASKVRTGASTTLLPRRVARSRKKSRDHCNRHPLTTICPRSKPVAGVSVSLVRSVARRMSIAASKFSRTSGRNALTEARGAVAKKSRDHCNRHPLTTICPRSKPVAGVSVSLVRSVARRMSIAASKFSRTSGRNLYPT